MFTLTMLTIVRIKIDIKINSGMSKILFLLFFNKVCVLVLKGENNPF